MYIIDVASYIPSNTIDNIEQGARFGEGEDFIREKIGAIKLSQMTPGEDTSDMAVKAVERVIQKSGKSRDCIDALVLITQNGDGRNLPHTSAIVHAKLGLNKNVAVFDISLGCSGYVYGLQILRGFMQASNFKNGILVTADPYSKIIDPNDRITSLLFGDAATATWVSAEGEWKLSQALMYSDGAGYESIKVSENKLVMNGRQVFNFAAMTIPNHIKELLLRDGLQEVDIDSYCLHQGSAAIIDAISKRFPKVKDRFALDLINQGNTVSSSIPLLLENAMYNSNNKKILICGFGVGLSWASMILTRKGY